jgi:molybdate transport system substrate-binding protein
MMRAIAFVLACLISSAAFAETITVAAAISLKDALTKVADQYKIDSGDSVEFAFGSSGQLAGQIQNGAPVDVFISAANKQVDQLEHAGIVDPAWRKLVAGNSLVLVVPSDSKLPATSLKSLAAQGVTNVAIGEPKSVPAGQYAEQALKHSGVYDAVKDKLILGTNVRQVLDYVERGEVSAGLVYSTDAKISGEKVRVTCTIDQTDHDPIVYPAAVIMVSKKQRAAKSFLDYVISNKGQATLREFGFTSPNAPASQPTQ